MRDDLIASFDESCGMLKADMAVVAGLAINLDDTARWLVVADLYEQKGAIDVAYAFRWAQSKNRRPRLFGRWLWYSDKGAGHSQLKTALKSYLPPAVFAADPPARVNVSFSTFLGAMFWLSHCLRAIRDIYALEVP